MHHEFPVIRHISDVLPHIEGRVVAIFEELFDLATCFAAMEK